MMRTLTDLSKVTFSPASNGFEQTCDTCGSIVAYALAETHVAFHADIAAWLIALRDGKGEA